MKQNVMRLSELSIRWRIALALGLMAVLVLLMAIISASGIRHASYLLIRADESHRQMELTSRLSSEVNAHLVLQLDALIKGRVSGELRQSRQRIDKLFTEMERSQQAEIGLLTEPEELESERLELQRVKRLNDEVESLIKQVVVVDGAVNDAAWPGSLHALTSQLLDTLRKRFQPLIRTVLDDEQAEIDAVAAAMLALRQELFVAGLLLVSACVLMAVAMAWLIYRSIQRPVDALIHATAAVSSGDLRSELPRFGRDELGLLARHFNRMARSLQRQRRKVEALNADLEDRVAERTGSLARSNARLQQIDASRKRFLANVSHELRTPLTAIIGETELSLGDLDGQDTELALSLQRIHANAGYMRRRVQDLLLLARSEEGELAIEPVVVDLVTLITDVCRQVRGIAEVERVLVSFEAAIVEAPARVDPAWIGQCLMSLIDNAVKFSSPGDGVSVALTDAGDAWRVEILDQGPGFDLNTMPKLFERYYQSEGGRIRGGAGLGLAIAHWIVSEHGGDIRASNQNEGACVTIELPKQGEQHEPAAV